MPGIRVNRPTGPQWDYSLTPDQNNWQTDPVFTQDGSGQPFVVGVVYTIFCRNQTQNLLIEQKIPFGQKDSNPNLKDVTDRSGWTDVDIVLDGNLFLRNLPRTELDYAQIVVNPDDGKAYLKGGTVSDSPLGLSIVNHFQEELIPPTPPAGKAALDSNTCESISGWGFSDQEYPPVVKITCDGQLAGYATASLPRSDVRDAMIGQGANPQGDILGFVWSKPAKYRDGQQHTWQVFVGDTGIEATDYNQPQINVCGAPIDPNPFVTGYRQETLNAVTIGDDALQVGIIEILSDLSERAYTGSVIPVWSVAGDPAGIVLTPNNTTKKVAVQATQDASVASFQLQCSLTQAQTVQVLVPACTRPQGLTTYKASWHFIPTGGNAQLYSTLEEANTIAGNVSDGTVSGDLDLFIFQANDLNVGTPVFLDNTDSCEKLGDNIYPIFDASGGNTIKKAMQVVGGKIVAVKAANRPPLVGEFPDQTVTQPGDQIIAIPDNLFTDPDGDPLVWNGYPQAGGNLPAGLSFKGTSPRNFTVGSAMLNGDYPLTISASDGLHAAATRNFVLHVNRQVVGPGPVSQVDVHWTDADPGFLNGELWIYIKLKASNKVQIAFVYPGGSKVYSIAVNFDSGNGWALFARPQQNYGFADLAPGIVYTIYVRQVVNDVPDTNSEISFTWSIPNPNPGRVRAYPA